MKACPKLTGPPLCTISLSIDNLSLIAGVFFKYYNKKSVLVHTKWVGFASFNFWRGLMVLIKKKELTSYFLNSSFIREQEQFLFCSQRWNLENLQHLLTFENCRILTLIKTIISLNKHQILWTAMQSGATFNSATARHVAIMNYWIRNK